MKRSKQSSQVRQPSTESLPEYLHQSAMQRSRSDGGFFPHRAHSAESRGLSFDSPLELARPKRVLSPPGIAARVSAVEGGSSYARKKFRNRSENTLSLSVDKSLSREEYEKSMSMSVDKGIDQEQREEKERRSPYPGPSFPSQEEHIAKKKRAMFQVTSLNSRIS